jgi:hypothetical protein
MKRYAKPTKADLLFDREDRPSLMIVMLSPPTLAIGCNVGKNGEVLVGI